MSRKQIQMRHMHIITDCIECFCYLQTHSESTCFFVTVRYILPCLDKLLDIVGKELEISAIVINVSR